MVNLGYVLLLLMVMVVVMMLLLSVVIGLWKIMLLWCMLCFAADMCTLVIIHMK